MANYVFSTDTDAGTITVLEEKDGGYIEVTKINVGNGPRGPVVFTKSGKGYVTNHAGNTISEIDPINFEEVSRIGVGAAPLGMGLLPNDNTLLVSNSGDNNISIVDLTRQAEIGKISTGREPKHMEILEDQMVAYVCIWGEHAISKIDLSPVFDDEKSNLKPDAVSVVSTTFLGDGAHPYSLRITPDKTRIIVANNQVNYVSVIDIASGEVEKNIDLGKKGSRGCEFSEDGLVVFVSVEDTSEIAAIDLNSLEIIQWLETGPGPRGMLRQGYKLLISSFTRTKSITASASMPNSVTLLDFSATINIQNVQANSAPGIQEIPVGAGPCSLSAFSTTQ